MPCLRLVFIYNARTQQDPVATAPQISFYERQHSLPNTLSLVLTRYFYQADECGAAIMSWPQKSQVKHSHEFTLQLRDDHFVYAGDLLGKSIRVQCGSLYTPLDICLASKSHQYVCHGPPYIAGQLTSMGKTATRLRDKTLRTGALSTYRRTFFPSRRVTWCILVIRLLIAFINWHIFELTSAKNDESRSNLCLVQSPASAHWYTWTSSGRNRSMNSRDSLCAMRSSNSTLG